MLYAVCHTAHDAIRFRNRHQKQELIRTTKVRENGEGPVDRPTHWLKGHDDVDDVEKENG
ncbi:hypothetical protein GCM10027185_05430 [Spirosoma pulveris]